MHSPEEEEWTSQVETLLVSACNVAARPRHSCLLLVDLESQQVRPIDVGAGDGWLVSGCGICADDTHIYHLTISQEEFATVLVVLDRASLEVMHVQELHEVVDGHSIARFDDELLVVSTGTDEIVSYSIDGQKAKDPRVMWSPTGSREDTHHINSVAVAGGEVVCSAFGPREDNSWATAKSGYVYNVSEGEVVVGGLRQPHTVTWHDGELYFCNSQRGSVNTPDGVVAELDGYSRGLAFGRKGRIYAATSIARHPVRCDDSESRFGNPGDAGDLKGRSSIVELARTGPLIDLTMSDHALEIYDLWALEAEGR